jgi:hypothetical protein
MMSLCNTVDSVSLHSGTHMQNESSTHWPTSVAVAMWVCTTCTFENPKPLAPVCEMCTAPRAATGGGESAVLGSTPRRATDEARSSVSSKRRRVDAPAAAGGATEAAHGEPLIHHAVSPWCVFLARVGGFGRSSSRSCSIALLLPHTLQ